MQIYYILIVIIGTLCLASGFLLAVIYDHLWMCLVVLVGVAMLIVVSYSIMIFAVKPQQKRPKIVLEK